MFRACSWARARGRPAIGRFLASAIAFILSYAFYFSETFRAGIEGVPKGQQEAAQVLGLTGPQTFLHITLLQMVSASCRRSRTRSSRS
ncbi:MAG: ABC transporter permease subunit [Oscillospiraceae bacterium]